MKVTGQTFKYVDFGLSSSLTSPFGFDVSLAGVKDGIVGLRRGNSGIATYNFSIGLISDTTGTKIGAYSEDEFNLSYRWDGSKVYQELNGNPVSIHNISSFQNPDNFYINVTSGAEIDVRIYGKTPDIAFSPISSTPSGFYGSFSDPANSGAKNTYHLNSITTTNPDLGVLYSETNQGGGSYRVTGSGLSGLTTVPLTFDFAFGKIQNNIEISQNGDSRPTQTGQSISLFGDEAVISNGQTLSFTSNYYSTIADSLRVRLDYEAMPQTVLLAGRTAGQRIYAGYVDKFGTLYSPEATGVADLTQPANIGLNQNYVLLDTTLNVSDNTPKSYTTVYYGNGSGNIEGVDLTGIYTGPNSSFIGQQFVGKTDVFWSYFFTSGDNGVHTFNSFTGKILKKYPYKIGGTTYNQYDPAIFPTGFATGTTPAEVTGKGYISAFSSEGVFTGYGYGRVSSDTIQTTGVGVGNVYYTGDITLEGQSLELGSDFQLNNFPDATNEKDGGFYSLAYTHYARGNIFSLGYDVIGTGQPTNTSPDWSYPSGASNIVIPADPPAYANTIQTLALPEYGVTGDFYGYGVIPPGIYDGPVFKGGHDTGLYNFTSSIFSGAAKYGRGIIESGNMRMPVNYTFIVNYSGGVVFYEKEFNVVFNRGTYEIWPESASGKYYNNRQVNGYPEASLTYESVPYLIFDNPSVYSQKVGQFTAPIQTPNQDGVTSYFNIRSGISSGSGIVDFYDQNLYNPERFLSNPRTMSVGYSQMYFEVDYKNENPSAQIKGKLKVYTNSNSGEVDITSYV